MAKIHISAILNSSENGVTSYDGYGILKDSRIIYYEDTVKVSIEYKDDTLKLERSNDDYSIILSFQNSLTNDGMYDIKCDSMQIPIKVTTNLLDVKDGLIHIEYSLLLCGESQGNFVYDVKYEVIQ